MKIVRESQHAKGTTLFEARPELRNEWDYEKNVNVTPDIIPYGSNGKYWWRCSNCNHSYEATANYQTVVRKNKHGKEYIALCPARCRQKERTKMRTQAKYMEEIIKATALSLYGMAPIKSQIVKTLLGPDREHIVKIIEAKLSSMTDSMKYVVSKRLTLDDTPCIRLEDLGAHLGVTRSRTHQIEHDFYITLNKNKGLMLELTSLRSWEFTTKSEYKPHMTEEELRRYIEKLQPNFEICRDYVRRNFDSKFKIQVDL